VLSGPSTECLADGLTRALPSPMAKAVEPRQGRLGHYPLVKLPTAANGWPHATEPARPDHHSRWRIRPFSSLSYGLTIVYPALTRTSFSYLQRKTERGSRRTSARNPAIHSGLDRRQRRVNAGFRSSTPGKPVSFRTSSGASRVLVSRPSYICGGMLDTRPIGPGAFLGRL